MGIDYNKAKVKRLQTQLSNLGLYDGDIDGNYDNVSGVVAKYQKDNGIDINDVKSGELNQSTWDSIMKNAPTIYGSTGSTDTSGSKNGSLDKANAALNALRDNAPGNFNFSGQTDLVNLRKQIDTYKDFSFDLNSDAFFEQYKDQFMNQGKLAMMDTMGQAQAMTGGYGNSYAQSVGQQAYNAELENLDDVALDLYTQAYNRWQDGRSALYDRYSLLSNERDAELEKYRVNLSKYYDDLAIAEDRVNNLTPTKTSVALSPDDYEKWESMLDGVTDEEEVSILLLNMNYAGIPTEITDNLFAQWEKNNAK